MSNEMEATLGKVIRFTGSRSASVYPPSPSFGRGADSGLPPIVSFDRRELQTILNVYGRGVAEGEWRDYALDFMGKNVNMSAAFVNFEVNRYFGWPGQAPSYKIGQRIWEQLAADATAKGISQKEFHRKALNLGGLGLDTLKFALSR